MLPTRIIKRLKNLNRRICCIETAADPIATVHSIRVSLCCIGRSWGHYPIVKQEIKRIRHYINCCVIAGAPPVTPTDPDAITFITAAGLTTDLQKLAIDQLVIDLKAANLWSKLYMIYPMIGGTASSHALNLKTPGAFTLTFNGGWVHSSTGAKGDGATAYAATGIIPNSHLPASNRHLSYYGRVNGVSGSEWGLYSSGQYLRMLVYTTFGQFYVDMDGAQQTASNGFDGTGFSLASRISSSDLKFYRRGVILLSYLGATAPNSHPQQIFLNAVNAFGPEEFCSRECAFASAGEGLTTTDATNLTTIVEAYETTLGRTA